MTLVYRARPIDRNVDSTWVHVGDEIDFALRAAGYLLYRPEGAFLVGAEVDPEPRLESINRSALYSADCVVALLPPGVPTLGVGREIEAAQARGIPVLIVADGNLWSGADCAQVPFSTRSADAVAGWVYNASASRPKKEPRELLVSLQSDAAVLPTKSYPGDAGHDLYASERVVVLPGQFADVPCGLAVGFPSGVWGRITGRSSTIRDRRLLVVEGVLDTGYRGPLFAAVWNLGGTKQVVNAGDRIAQLILHENLADGVRLTEVDDLPPSERGSAGFGSSGR